MYLFWRKKPFSEMFFTYVYYYKYIFTPLDLLFDMTSLIRFWKKWLMGSPIPWDRLLEFCQKGHELPYSIATYIRYSRVKCHAIKNHHKEMPLHTKKYFLAWVIVQNQNSEGIGTMICYYLHTRVRYLPFRA